MSHSETIEVEKNDSLSIPEILADFFLKKIDMPSHSDDSDHKRKNKRKKSKHKKRKHKKSKHRHRSSSSGSSSRLSELNKKDVVDEEMGIKRLKKIKSLKIQSVSDTVLQSNVALSAQTEVKNENIQPNSSNNNPIFYGPSLQLLITGVENNDLDLKPRTSENDLCSNEQKNSGHVLSKADSSSVKVQDIASSSDSFVSLQTEKNSVIISEIDNIRNTNNTVNESKQISKRDIKQNDCEKDLKQIDSKKNAREEDPPGDMKQNAPPSGDMKQNDSKSDMKQSHFENVVKNESESSIKEGNCENRNKETDSKKTVEKNFPKERSNDSKTEAFSSEKDKKNSASKKSNKGNDSAIDEKDKNDSDHKTENSSSASKSRKKSNSKKKHSRSRSKSRSRTKHTSVKSKRERSRSRSRDSYSKKKKRRHSLEKSRSRERKVRSRSRSHSRSRYRRSRRNSRSRSPYERYSRRKSRSRSRSYARSRKRSKSKTRRHSRSRERHRSSSKSKHRTKSSKKSASRSKSRSKSRTRHKSPSKEKSRSKSKEKNSSPKSTKIDQAKILETARKNVLKMMKNGTLPDGLPVENIKKEQLMTIQSGGKSVQELTDFCQRLSQKENEPDASENEENDDNADDENGFIHHPFKVKEPTMIKLNIKNAVQLPIKTHAQKIAETTRLSSQFPVSSGNQHKQKELEWVPVVPESSKTVTKSTETTVSTTAEVKTAVVAVPEVPPPPPPIPLPPAPPVTMSYACPPPTEVTTIEPPISIPPATIVPPPMPMPCVPPPPPPPPLPPPPPPLQEPVQCTFYQMPPPPVMQTYVTPNQQMLVPFSTVSTPVPSTSVFKPPRRLDISSIVTKRFQALTKLQENPNDSESLRILQEAQERIQEWVQSQQVPGLFTGSTDAKMLSVAELCGPFKYHKNRKDILSHAPPVTEGKGMSLLKKMGWNPGEGLGKNKEGSLEPLVLDIKTDKKGLVSEGENSKKGVSSFVKELQGKHPVSALMELCSKRKWKPPLYECVLDHGPPHKKLFCFKVEVNGIEYQPVNPCSNKKIAKADAAVLCLQSLNVLPKIAIA